jgi:hypothetical protein
MLPKGVAHQEKVGDTYTQGIPPHLLAFFIRQEGDKHGSNEWEQDNRGQPGKSFHHGVKQKYLFVYDFILLNFVKFCSNLFHRSLS